MLTFFPTMRVSTDALCDIAYTALAGALLNRSRCPSTETLTQCTIELNFGSTASEKLIEILLGEGPVESGAGTIVLG